MALTSIRVEDFQSLASADIRLGKLTVVTGPSNSGKTAVIRALRLLAFNARGTDYIRRGQAACKVASGVREEGWAVGITRGGRGKDAYRVSRLLEPATPGDYSRDPDEPVVDTYTKLGGGVPEAVTRLLALTELNFAGQFDRPYLLDETGTQIARTLGELTNVAMVLRAAQEAGRARKEIARDLKSAAEKLERLREQARGYAGLKQRLAAITGAEEHLAGVQQRAEALGRLRMTAARLDAECQLAEGAARVAEHRAAPSLEPLDAIQGQLSRVRELNRRYADCARTVPIQEAWREKYAGREARAHQAVHEALVAAGQCPLCGQAVT